jgi:hypothetical protein
MLDPSEWRFGRSDDLGKIRICVVATKAVEAQCGLGFMQGLVGNLVEDASEIVEKVDRHLISFGFDECPILLEHLDYLDPEVATLDWNDLPLRR